MLYNVFASDNMLGSTNWKKIDRETEITSWWLKSK